MGEWTQACQDSWATIRPTDMEAMDRGETGNEDKNGEWANWRYTGTGGRFPQRCVRVEGAARPGMDAVHRRLPAHNE